MPEEINRNFNRSYKQCSIYTIKNCDRKFKKKRDYDHFNHDIVHSGDVMQDGAIFYNDFAQKPNFDVKKEFILATIHRAENTNDICRLKSIIEALNEISYKKQVVLPIHPRTRAIIEKYNINLKFDVIEPVGYLEMIWFLKNCSMVMSDSGGLQKEAFFFKKPCITLRDETEWDELIFYNFNVLVGASKSRILNTYNNHKFNDDFSLDLFGLGLASQKIINYFLENR
uniref:UDP-N-acetylglucosamine 2-epimerase n=1 Tax=uncultured organism TaxID=155900 RepID=K7NAI3_9ZZZZ|nr:UDP-N-acetylglucosamine 2-epimerase [uncultured organism]